MPKPPAPAVRRFVKRNAVDPGLQARLSVKVLDPAKHFQKYFLGGVRSVSTVRNDSINQAIDGLMELVDQLVVGQL